MKKVIDIQKHILPTDSTVSQALTRLNSLPGDKMTLFVCDAHETVIGTLTDGDIRRGLLSGVSLDDSVENVMHRAFRHLKKDENNYNRFIEARSLGISLLPELDSEGQLTSIVSVKNQHSMLPIDAVLMAGGKGERLRPLTLNTPKPLLPVGDKPIIEYNVEALVDCGVKNIFVTVNYLHHQLEEYFTMRHTDDNRVTCVREPAPLGTFGSVSLINDLHADNLLVMNSDLLTDIDFEAMYDHHISSGAELTMGVVPYTVSVPYAILRTDKDLVLGMEEKPTYNYLANGGVYMMKRACLESIKTGGRLDAPDFIDSLIASGKKVSYFLINGRWIDIGSPDDYRYACSLMEGRTDKA